MFPQNFNVLDYFKNSAVSVAILLQVAKWDMIPHSFVLCKTHLNTELPSTFNGNA